jgi:hypothetical protein
MAFATAAAFGFGRPLSMVQTRSVLPAAMPAAARKLAVLDLRQRAPALSAPAGIPALHVYRPVRHRTGEAVRNRPRASWARHLQTAAAILLPVGSTPP